jgi:hypothetical protein
MEKVIILIITFLSFTITYTQDIIMLKSGEKLKVKVTENLDSKIKYKKFNNQDGPTYYLNKNEISKITYENGSIEKFAKTNKKKEEVSKSDEKNPDIEFNRLKEKSLRYNTKRNLISFNYGQMILLNMEFSYEGILDKHGFVGLKIPLSVGMNLNNQYLKKNNIFSTGIHLNIYPLGQGKVSYLTGPAIRYFYMQDNPSHFSSPSISTEKAHYIGFYMNNGVLFQATSFLNFSLGLGLGTRRDISRSAEPAKFDVIFDGSIIFRI